MRRIRNCTQTERRDGYCGREPASREAASTPPAGLPVGTLRLLQDRKDSEAHRCRAPGAKAVRTELSLTFLGSSNVQNERSPIKRYPNQKRNKDKVTHDGGDLQGWVLESRAGTLKAQ